MSLRAQDSLCCAPLRHRAAALCEEVAGYHVEGLRTHAAHARPRRWRRCRRARCHNLCSSDRHRCCNCATLPQKHGTSCARLAPRSFFERALAAADAALPRDSLIIADLLRAVTVEYARLGRDARGGVSCKATLAAIWREDPQLLVAARRALDILRARWCAGSLFNFTPEEEAFFGESDTTFHHEHWDIKGTGADLYITCAAQTLDCWPPPSTRADEMARLHDIHNALRAALQLCAPLLGVGGSRCFAFPPHTLAMLHSLTARLHRGILHPLRCDCGLTLVDETALRRLAPMVNRSIGEVDRQFAEDDAACAKAAAADVARHGLRRCALPSCNATEPHPKRYKLCGRCRGVAYCSAAHSAEDWKRHKREDGCAAAP